jgi:hypothetical protein
MDAPLITLDDPANTTDVYAFLHTRRSDNAKVLATALAVYPFQEPGIGPNNFRFDDGVLYEIHVLTGNDVAAGRATFTYQFRFTTSFKKRDTILQAFLGVVQDVDDANQNLTQRYTVTRVDRRTGLSTALGAGVVPPNNQGNATPRYNIDNNGERPARPGVAREEDLDRYTRQAITSLSGGHRSFAGQREDGFYADIQAIFDLLKFRSGQETFDSQAGFNLHEIALEIPVSDLGGDQQVVGVYATTSRPQMRVLNDGAIAGGPTETGRFVQVARQGNPLFNEGLVALVDKDRYNRTQPTEDQALFDKYARSPELAKLINVLIFDGRKVAQEENRTDLVGIFIPDVIKVDLSTAPARLAGGGRNFAGNRDDEGFSRLGIFGNDVLTSRVQTGFFNNGTVPGGWPNGRRYGDDVVDIAVTAILSDLRDPANPRITSADGIDNVSRNDSVYSKVFPYAGTPHNGRRHSHHNVGAAGQTSQNRFQNLSTRALVRGGEQVLIGGFIIRGDANRRVAIRGLGRSMSSRGVGAPLTDPVLQVFRGQERIAQNDNFKDSGDEAELRRRGLAPEFDEEAALIVVLAPGAYTVIVRNKDERVEGVGLVEAYDLE